MQTINLDISNTLEFIMRKDIDEIKKETFDNHSKLHNKSGLGRDFLGWVNLPSSISKEDINNIKAAAEKISAIAEYVVVVGIGGSYLGARAIIDALSDSFGHLKTERKHPIILYAGQNISEDYTHDLLDLLKDKSFAIVVISKSGTTTEPAIAFRLLKNLMEKKYKQDEIKQRIIAITDKTHGALRTLANLEGYQTFVIPDNVGGRFSVLTPVGLLPIAIAGIDIKKLIDGAKFMEDKLTGTNYDKNPAALYAAIRNILYRKGKKIEILVNYNPRLQYLAEWWKQLFGESEGKQQKGLFTASVNFTTDLHSLGQWIQESERSIFETVISIEHPKYNVEIPETKDDLDKLNYLAGKRLDEVNGKAEIATTLAHIEGGVPNIRIALTELNEYCLGQLIYFFETACGISGYLLDVNPFDQPGVEAYKNKMFELLGKPATTQK